MADEQFLPERVGLTRAAVSFLAEALGDPVLDDGVFRSDYVAQEAEMLRRRIESTINNRPQYAVNRLREEMCKDEPFGLHKYGDLETLRNVSPSGLFEHYQNVLRTSPVDLFVVGPVDPDEMASLVKEHFSLPRGAIDETTPAVTYSPDEERTVVEEQPVQQGVLAMGYRTGVRYADDDYPALLVYNGILGGFPHSKLFVNVRERASLAYFASSQLEATKGILIVAAGIAVEKYEQALAIIREQIDAIAQGDVSDSEMEQTKKGLVNGLLSNLDSPGRLAGGRLMGIVNNRVRVCRAIDRRSAGGDGGGRGSSGRASAAGYGVLFALTGRAIRSEHDAMANSARRAAARTGAAHTIGCRPGRVRHAEAGFPQTVRRVLDALRVR